MKRVILAVFMVMLLLSSKGRVAWFGEREFKSNVQLLNEEGYTIDYIETVDEKTLVYYDALVICFAETSKEQKEAIFSFVENGGGLLIIYDVLSHGSVESVATEYQVEPATQIESDIVFPFLPKERIDELKKRIAISQRGKGKIIIVGYDPVTFQALSLVLNVDSIFKLGLNWLCQDWHVEQTQKLLMIKRMKLLTPLAVGAVASAGAAYYLYRRRKKEEVTPGEPDREEQIRQLKARFVYGELSKDQYHEELERLQHLGK